MSFGGWGGGGGRPRFSGSVREPHEIIVYTPSYRKRVRRSAAAFDHGFSAFFFSIVFSSSTAKRSNNSAAARHRSPPPKPVGGGTVIRYDVRAPDRSPPLREVLGRIRARAVRAHVQRCPRGQGGGFVLGPGDRCENENVIEYKKYTQNMHKKKASRRMRRISGGRERVIE